MLFGLGVLAGNASAAPAVFWKTPEDGKPGIGAGRFRAPLGLGVNPISGHVYVGDHSNARIDELDPWGTFVKAWGWGVVASGPDDKTPKNEIQKLTVDAGGGTYKLRFSNTFGGGASLSQVTGSIASNAPASKAEGAGSIEAALEGLESLGPGDVTVSGGPGNVGGTNPYTIEFTGSYADADVEPLGIVVKDSEGNFTLSGGAASAGIETVQQGGSFEICIAANNDVCQSGQSGGSSPGHVANSFGRVAADGAGNVYVFEIIDENQGEGRSIRVQKFDSVGNFVLMFGGEVDKTTKANLCTKASGDACGVGVPGTGTGQFKSNNTGGGQIAIGPTGTVFVADLDRIQAFNPDGAFKEEIPIAGITGVPGAAINSLTVDGSGNFYISLSAKEEVRKLNGSGAELKPPSPFMVPNPQSLVAGAGTAVYVVSRGSLAEGDKIFELPDGVAFGQIAGIQGWGVARSAACGIEGEDVFVTERGSGEEFIRAYGPPPDPHLPGCEAPIIAPTITDQYATSVNTVGAVLGAQINPHFWDDTRYYVEYGTGKCSEGGCTQTQPLAPGSKLTDDVVNSTVKTSGVFLSALQPATTYHYRFVAQSTGSDQQPVRGVGGTVGVDGAEGSFRTFPGTTTPPPCANDVFRSGASAKLPDCRAYEMVSPIEKNNGDILALEAADHRPAALDQSASDGEKLTYSTFRAFGDAPSAPISSQYLATRIAGVGWSNHGISPARGKDLLALVPSINNQFKAFSPDLCSGWLVHETDPPLASGAVEGFPNVYRRSNCAPQADSYTALTTVEPPSTEPNHFIPEIQGVSADGSHTAFRVRARLTPDAPDPGANNYLLYDALGDGEPNFVCLLPDETPVSGGCSAGTSSGTLNYGRQETVDRAISTDGSRIFWSDANFGEGKLYVRIGDGETRAVSKGGETLSGKSNAQFWTAAADGSRAIFSVGSLGSGSADLYEYHVDAGETHKIVGSVYGLLGASEDASRIYLVSKEALDGAAVAGKPNLYLAEEEGGGGFALSFIGVLSGEDVSAAAGQTPINVEPLHHTSRIPSDGAGATFMSSSKTLADATASYDNTDQANGRADAEVYLYDAAAERLSCVSCNPTGARPLGRDVGGEGGELFAAAQIPGWETQLYPVPRVLNDDGSRLFFESFETLVPSDTNGKQDVYQWEALGEGACGEGSPGFSEASGGCVDLISSGESPQNSEIVDASQGGDDVFISTSAGLLPQDPGLIDIYDARANGGLPAQNPPEASCEGEACQSPPPAPEDPTPATSTLRGNGNFTDEGSNAPCPKGKRKVRKAGKTHCVKRQKKAHHGKRRAQRNRGASR